MKLRFLNQVFKALICFGMILPSSSYATTQAKVIYTDKGSYSIIQNVDELKRIRSQIIIGPDSQENQSDINGDRIWDHWELVKGDITAIADNPVGGHYSQLKYFIRTPRGTLKTEFVYDQKNGTYLMINKGFYRYRIFKAENIIIGECSRDDTISKLASNWNDIFNTLDNQKLKSFLNSGILNFIDQSCREGKFAKSIDAIQTGMVSVFASSFRTNKKGSGRFLQCMDAHGLGVHADRIRSSLYSKMNSEMSEFIINSGVFLDQSKNTRQSKMTESHTDKNIYSTIDDTHGLKQDSTIEAELKEGVKVKQLISDLNHTSKKPLVNCKYMESSDYGVERARWSENTGQITLCRTLGEQIPTHTPAYAKVVPEQNTKISASKVDSDNYAKAFFHELIHSSFIEDEDFTESIENCCGLAQGFDWNNPACKAMQKLIEKASGHQSFIYAITKKNPQKYEDYHKALVKSMENSPDSANRLEGNVINRFKTQTDQCVPAVSHCNETIESVLIKSKKKCEETASAPSEKDFCLKKFNNDFYDKMHDLYEDECRKFVSQVMQLDCKNLATGFLNVFGDCSSKVSSFEFNNKVQYVLKLVSGANAFAIDNKKCDCFDIAFNSSPQNLTNIGNTENKIDPAIYSVTDKPGQDAINNGKLSTGPVTKEMLEQMVPIPNSQMTKEFAIGYERRSTIVIDSALSVLSRVKNEIFPVAEAKVDRNTSGSGFARSPASSVASAMRIADPFKGGASIDDSRKAGISVAGQEIKPKKSEINEPITAKQSAADYGVGVGSVATNSLESQGAQIGSNSAREDNQNKAQSSARGAAGGTFGASAGGSAESAARSIGESAAGGTSAASATSVGGAAQGSASASGFNALNTSNSLKNKNEKGRGLASQTNYKFSKLNQLLKFLIGPYSPVVTALKSPDFIKTLIDYEVKVVDHNDVRFGSRNARYNLQFRQSKNRLEIIEEP